MKEYMLVSISDKGVHTSAEAHFQRRIQYLINSGWQLQGGVSVCSIYDGEYGSTLLYMQGLVREDHP
jgi:hypothetical protein